MSASAEETRPKVANLTVPLCVSSPANWVNSSERLHAEYGLHQTVLRIVMHPLDRTWHRADKKTLAYGGSTRESGHRAGDPPEPGKAGLSLRRTGKLTELLNSVLHRLPINSCKLLCNWLPGYTFHTEHF